MIITYLTEYNRYLNILGLLLIIGGAIVASTNRKKIDYRLIFKALALQFITGFLILRFSLGRQILAAIGQAIVQMYHYADAGTAFVFGPLANAQGPLGFIFAFKVLPVTIFFSPFIALLFHFSILQRVVLFVSYLMRPLLPVSAAESLCAIANSFLSQTEAPLLIRGYLHDMTKSEFFTVMVSGMATISAAILAVYVAMGVSATHMLASSLMSIFGAIMMSKIIIPETHEPKTAHGAKITFETTSTNMFDAIATGTSDGLTLALAIGAMLISFLALLALGNGLLANISHVLNFFLPQSAQIATLTFDKIMAYVFFPFGYLLGLTGDEAFKAGQLVGIKVAVNELIAYSEMVKMNLSPRAVDLITYALCGFSNFSCIGIQIGAIGALAPTKRQWLTQMGIYAVFTAALSNLATAMIAGLLL